MKILSIGNSFSQDAHKWLSKLAKLNGFDFETSNLYIGSCSLETHFKNVQENNPFYDYEVNGNPAERKISIAEALSLKKWDIITLQQVSGLSGIYESYEPYLSSLVSVIKNAQPEAKIYFHQTWAYELNSQHKHFVNYENNQAKMFEAIKSSSQEVVKSLGIKLIPTGTVIQMLRETVDEFNFKNGGISLCRDGFHLSFDYGRFTAAATWLHTLTNKNIENTTFENFDTGLLEKIVEVVNKL